MIAGTCHCGGAGWTLDGVPESATACSCTLCRRYGVLWAYDFENERIRLTGLTSAYVRADEADPGIEMRFCSTCGCLLAWRSLKPREDDRRRMAVNLRMAPPDQVAEVPIIHLDGLQNFDERQEGCVRDLWY